jgi:phage-related protein
MIKSGMSLDEVMGVLSETFGGAASEAANTTAGKFKLMKISIDETKESIGASLMPVVEAVLPYLQSMAKWAQDNPGVFTIIAGTIGAIAVSILAVNTAMALNPFGLIAVGIGLLVTGIGIANTKFEGFRSLVRTVVNGLSDYFEFMANSWIKATNVLITAMNLISPFKDIPKIGAVSFGKIGAEPTKGGFTSTAQAEAAMFSAGGGGGGGGVDTTTIIPTSLIPTALGGSAKTVNASTPEPIFTDMGQALASDFSQTGIGGIQGLGDVIFNINGGDPNAVVDALRDFMRNNGSVPIVTAGIY